MYPRFPRRGQTADLGYQSIILTIFQKLKKIYIGREGRGCASLAPFPFDPPVEHDWRLIQTFSSLPLKSTCVG